MGWSPREVPVLAVPGQREAENRTAIVRGRSWDSNPPFSSQGSCTVSGLMRAQGRKNPNVLDCGPKATRDPAIPEETSGENNSTLIPGSGCCFLSHGLAPLAAIGSCSRDSPGQGGCRDKDPSSGVSIYFQIAAWLPVASLETQLGSSSLEGN